MPPGSGGTLDVAKSVRRKTLNLLSVGSSPTIRRDCVDDRDPPYGCSLMVKHQLVELDNVGSIPIIHSLKSLRRVVRSRLEIGHPPDSRPRT